MQLQKVLKKLMSARKLSFQELSNETGVSASTLKGWTLPKANPRNMDQVRRVAQVLGVSFEYLIFGEDSEDLPRSLEEVLTEPVYDGWLKVKIERMIPNRPNKK